MLTGLETTIWLPDLTPVSTWKLLQIEVRCSTFDSIVTVVFSLPHKQCAFVKSACFALLQQLHFVTRLYQLCNCSSSCDPSALSGFSVVFSISRLPPYMDSYRHLRSPKSPQGYHLLQLWSPNHSLLLSIHLLFEEWKEIKMDVKIMRRKEMNAGWWWAIVLNLQTIYILQHEWDQFPRTMCVFSVRITAYMQFAVLNICLQSLD